MRGDASGGGAYIVARDNLGVVAAQTAGAALLIDYILTVSVSVAAGIDAIISAAANRPALFHTLDHWRGAVGALSGPLLTPPHPPRGRGGGAVFAPPAPTFFFVTLGPVGGGVHQ